jgi:hypothetical protein
MSLEAIIVQGTLKPDGTLELDTKPALPPGRVHVTLWPVPAGSTRKRLRKVEPRPIDLTLQPGPAGSAPKGGLADTIEEIRRYQQAHGYKGRTTEEMARDEAERRADDDAYDQRMEELWSQTQSGATSGGS